MSEFIDVISPKALEQLKLANAEIVTMVSNVKKVNENLIGAKTPSGSDSALKALTAEYQKQEQAIKKLQEQLIKLNEQKKTTNARTSEEIVNQRALATASDRQARATSNLVGAYANLSAQVAIASQKYQDLIARGRTATQTQSQYNKELRQAQTEFRTLQTRVLQADKAVDKWNRTGERSIGFARNLMGAFGVVGGVTLFATVTTDIINTTKELQGLNNALMLVTDTQENFYSQQIFLKEISEAFGLEIMGLTKQFTQFYVSAKDKISSQEIQDIFRSISKAGASMGLSVQQQERAFLALNQMMSKGTIQAEELRGQLGEALPGAFGIMAEAVGVTEKELGNMMKAGELLASDVLPKFAQQLEKTYGIENINRIETMTSATNRLSNAWTSFVGTIGASDGVLSKTFTKILNFLSKAVEGFRLMTMSEQERSLERIGQIVSKDTESYKEYLSTLDLTNKAILEQEKNALKLGITRSQNARREIESLNAELKALEGRGSVFERDRNQIRQRIEILEIQRQKYLAQVDAFEEAVKAENKKTESSKKETETTKANTEAKKEAETYAIGSVKWIKQQINQIQELNDTLSTNSEEYQVGVGAIKFYEEWLKRLTETAKKTEKEIDGISLNLSDIKPMTDEEGDELMEAGNRLREILKEFKKGFIDEFGQESGFGKTLDILSGGLKKFEGDAVATALSISDAFQEAFNTIAQNSQANFEQQYEDLEQSKRIDILFAGESATAREEIERQYEERRKEIQRRQAQAQKNLALFNIATNTAQGIVSALAMTPPNVPLSIAIGAIGAVQLGMVASQQIPQFYKGTDNAPEGWAWTQEKGAEIITDKSGRVKDTGSNGGAKLTYLSKGDKVFTADQSKNIMFNKELNSILNNNGILPTNVINNKLDLLPLRSDIRSLENTIKNKSELHMISDRQGFSIYQKEQGKRALLVSNRLRIKS
jgi:tape measure domain-containing protein